MLYLYPYFFAHGIPSRLAIDGSNKVYRGHAWNFLQIAKSAAVQVYPQIIADFTGNKQRMILHLFPKKCCHTKYSFVRLKINRSLSKMSKMRKICELLYLIKHQKASVLILKVCYMSKEKSNYVNIAERMMERGPQLSKRILCHFCC